MINIYFSDTEVVEACICRLNAMWCDDQSQLLTSHQSHYKCQLCCINVSNTMTLLLKYLLKDNSSTT